MQNYFFKSPNQVLRKRLFYYSIYFNYFPWLAIAANEIKNIVCHMMDSRFYSWVLKSVLRLRSFN